MPRQAAVALFCAVVAAAQAPEAFNHARKLQQDGHLADAERAYRAYLKSYGATPEVLANLGAVLVQQERFSEAIAHYKQAIVLAPKMNPLRLNLGLAYLKSGDRAGALAEFSAGLRQGPPNRQLRQLRALTLLELERFEEAAIEYAKLMPGDVSVRLGLATAYTRLGKEPEAQKALGALLDRRDSAEVEMLRGQAMFAENRFDEARAAFQLAARLNPKLETVHFHLGAIYWKQQQTAEALEEWRLELEAQPEGFQPNYTLGAALALAGRPDAEPLLRKAVALKPHSAQALYQLAKLVWQRSKSEEAVSLLERSVASQAKYREARYLLASVYQALGRKADAAREFAAVRAISERELQRTRDIFEGR
ncbi:MAG: tetratricopeptide repeat protein [Bryobacterales bacterium]|nr:tetratricopeptide repeat protein [Bryobacterales bacterium]